MVCKDGITALLCEMSFCSFLKKKYFIDICRISFDKTRFSDLSETNERGLYTEAFCYYIISLFRLWYYRPISLKSRQRHFTFRMNTISQINFSCYFRISQKILFLTQTTVPAILAATSYLWQWPVTITMDICKSLIFSKLKRN